MNETAELICPKCQGRMRNYERNGIQIDQCQDCRGIFLDRGELERLIDAEGAYVRSTPAAVGESESDDGEREGGTRRKRRGGFLGDMFEGFGD